MGADELRLLPAIAEMGYDGVEVPIFDAPALEWPRLGRALAESGLACTVSTALPAGLNLIDEDIADAGVACLRERRGGGGGAGRAGGVRADGRTRGRAAWTRLHGRRSGIAACDPCAR